MVFVAMVPCPQVLSEPTMVPIATETKSLNVFWLNVLLHAYCCHGDSVLVECPPPWLLLP